MLSLRLSCKLIVSKKKMHLKSEIYSFKQNKITYNRRMTKGKSCEMKRKNENRALYKKMK